MRIGMKNVAALAGVSKTAVSLYINNHPHAKKLAPDTRLRIDEAIRKTGYKPSATARALTSGKTKTLGLVVGGIANEYYAHFAEAALNESTKRGYQLMVSLTRWNKEEEERCLENLINRQTDGILYYPALRSNSKIYQRLNKSSYPLLLVEQESSDFSTVRNSIATALQEALAELKKLGHKHICGVLGTSLGWHNDYIAACQACNQEVRLLDMPLSTRKEKLAAVHEICRLRPSALIINGRLTSNLLIQHISQHHPEYRPAIIMKYDFYNDVINHDLITGVIYCHSAQIVKTAINTLINRVEGKDGTLIRHELVHSEFVPRAEFDETFQNDEELWE